MATGQSGSVENSALLSETSEKYIGDESGHSDRKNESSELLTQSTSTSLVKTLANNRMTASSEGYQQVCTCIGTWDRENFCTNAVWRSFAKAITIKKIGRRNEKEKGPPFVRAKNYSKIENFFFDFLDFGGWGWNFSYFPLPWLRHGPPTCT